MVAGGELAGVIGVKVDHPDVQNLIPDAVGFEALRTRGHYPINHVVVVKDEVLQRHPDAAAALIDAFTEAKNVYVNRLQSNSIEQPDANDQRYRKVAEIIDGDPLPYGIDPNRAAISELIQYAVDQRILAEPPTIESLFV
jgi:4,5-dihydroxyphthalate decarboxylase